MQGRLSRFTQGFAQLACSPAIYNLELQRSGRREISQAGAYGI